MIQNLVQEASQQQKIEHSPASYPDWRKFDQFDPNGAVNLTKLDTLTYRNPAGKRKDVERPIVADQNGDKWIGNPVKTDQDIMHFYAIRSEENYRAEGSASPEAYFVLHFLKMYSEELNGRDKSERVQYVAWRLAQLLPLEHYSLPEVKSGVLEGKRYVWTKYVEDVVQGGSIQSYLKIHDYTEEERVERNTLYALLRKNDKNILNDLRSASGQLHAIDFEYATGKELLAPSVWINPFDSDESYEKVFARFRTVIDDDPEGLVNFVRQIVKDSGFDDQDYRATQLRYLLDYDVYLMRIVRDEREKYRESVRKEYGQPFALLAYEDTVDEFFPNDNLPRVLDNTLREQLQNMLTIKDKIPKENVYELLETEGMITKQGSDWFIPSLGITVEDLWLSLSRFQKPVNFIKR